MSAQSGQPPPPTAWAPPGTTWHNPAQPGRPGPAWPGLTLALAAGSRAKSTTKGARSNLVAPPGYRPGTAWVNKSAVTDESKLAGVIQTLLVAMGALGPS